MCVTALRRTRGAKVSLSLTHRFPVSWREPNKTQIPCEKDNLGAQPPLPPHTQPVCVQPVCCILNNKFLPKDSVWELDEGNWGRVGRVFQKEENGSMKARQWEQRHLNSKNTKFNQAGSWNVRSGGPGMWTGKWVESWRAFWVTFIESRPLLKDRGDRWKGLSRGVTRWLSLGRCPEFSLRRRCWELARLEAWRLVWLVSNWGDGLEVESGSWVWREGIGNKRYLVDRAHSTWSRWGWVSVIRCVVGGERDLVWCVSGYVS